MRTVADLTRVSASQLRALPDLGPGLREEGKPASDDNGRSRPPRTGEEALLRGIFGEDGWPGDVEGADEAG